MYVAKSTAMPNENRCNESECNQLTVPHQNCACNLRRVEQVAIKIKHYYLIQSDRKLPTSDNFHH